MERKAGSAIKQHLDGILLARWAKDILTAGAAAADCRLFSSDSIILSLFFLIIVQICFTFQNADNYMLLGHISSLQATMIHSVFFFVFFLISLIFLNVLQNKTQVLVLLNAPLQQPRKWQYSCLLWLLDHLICVTIFKLIKTPRSLVFCQLDLPMTSELIN